MKARTGNGQIKKLLIALSCLFFLIISFVTMAMTSEMVRLQANDNGKDIQVKTGAIIELSLEELGSAGYTWELNNLDEKHFELLKTETKPRGEKNRIGAAVIKTWQFKAKEPGASQISLDYFRPWEGKAKAVKHFQVQVHIM